MKNLPGVEINDDGEIEVEGKTVSKVMVEGKDFFDGDSKIASKNIPSSAVDKVQILKNYSEISQLSSVQNNQDNIAINIKLKKVKINFGLEIFWQELENLQFLIYIYFSQNYFITVLSIVLILSET